MNSQLKLDLSDMMFTSVTRNDEEDISILDNLDTDRSNLPLKSLQKSYYYSRNDTKKKDAQT